MFFKKKMKNLSTAFIMFIYIITFLLPSKLTLAELITTPVINLVGESTVYVAYGSNYIDQGVTITDDKDTGLTAKVTYTKDGTAVSYISPFGEGTYLVHYNVTDSDTNAATEVTRTVIVQTVEDESIADNYKVNGYETNLGFSLLSDEETENLLEGAITTPAAVRITREDDILTAKIIKENDKEFTTSAAITYEWYVNDQLVQEGTEYTYAITNADNGKNIVVKVEQYNLESEPFYIDEDGSQVAVPAAVKIEREDDTLTAELVKEDKSKFTTSAQVTYEWYREDELIKEGIEDTYNISDEDIGNSIIVKVEQYDLESEPFYIDEDEPQVTTPAAISVKIKGTEKVGYTLTGELILEDGNEFTTGSAVTYEWYRLSSANSENDELVGDNKTYKLVSRDQNKYIKLVISYEDEIYEAITSKIRKRSSSSSSSSSSNSNSSSSTNNNSSTTENNQVPATNNNEALLVEGWNFNSKEWRFIKNGQVINGWNQIDGYWYLMDPTGVMLTGWQQMNGAWYLLRNTGAMATGWQQVSGTWYLLKSDGAMATGWQQVNGTWYLLKNNGAMVTGWQQINGIWYLLKDDGAMAIGWQQVNGTWYLFNSSGALTTY